MTVQGDVTLGFNLTNISTSDSEATNIRMARSIVSSFVDGVGSGAINALWQDIGSLPDTTPVNLDVSPTASSGVSGIVTFARVKVVLVWCPTTNTTNITVVRHATTGVPVFNVAASGVVLKPGGFFAFVDPSATGVAVTGGASDLFTLTNSGATAATYSIVIGGGLT